MRTKILYDVFHKCTPPFILACYRFFSRVPFYVVLLNCLGLCFYLTCPPKSMDEVRRGRAGFSSTIQETCQCGPMKAFRVRAGVGTSVQVSINQRYLCVIVWEKNLLQPGCKPGCLQPLTKRRIGPTRR
jgi:hypothetical protein